MQLSGEVYILFSMHFKKENKIELEPRKCNNSCIRVNLKSRRSKFLKKAIKWMSILVRKEINLYVRETPN